MHGRQPKVILTNVLRTKIGRKYTQAQPKTDANFSDAGKLQSNQPPSSSVASLKIWQILNPALHSPFLSKRYVLFAFISLNKIIFLAVFHEKVFYVVSQLSCSFLFTFLCHLISLNSIASTSF